MADRAHALAFLYKIIDDNQSTIRFLDTKAAFGIAIIGAMAGKFLDQDQFRAVWRAGAATRGAAGIFVFFTIVGAVLAFKTVFPMVNPARNVTFPDDLHPQFFVSKFKNPKWFRLFSSSPRYAILEETFSKYSDAVAVATPEAVEKILCAEVLKLSFIRQMKTDRLAAFAWVLILTILSFVSLTYMTPHPSSAPLRGGCVSDHSIRTGH